MRLVWKTMTVRDAIAEAAAVIARRDAETLLSHVLRQERAWLLGHPEASVGEAERLEFRALVARRAGREPLQYLTGVQEFLGLPLRVTRDTLIPRPETEHLVEAVLAWVSSRAWEGAVRIVDVGTGSGAIAVALAKQLPTAEVWAGDVSGAALAVARGNAEALGVKVRLVESDLLAGLGGQAWDVVVSNPPYVPSGDAAEMQAEVRDFEPHGALFAGEDGMAVYRRLVPQAWDALRPGGLLAMEFGFGQRALMAELLAGWESVRFVEDYAGIPRVMVAERPGNRE
jgi:release factor glutamine methyltransferase